MANLFLYGTLCDTQLLDICLSKSLNDINVQHATLADHAVYWVKNENYPTIINQNDAAIPNTQYVTPLKVGCEIRNCLPQYATRQYVTYPVVYTSPVAVRASAAAGVAAAPHSRPNPRRLHSGPALEATS